MNPKHPFKWRQFQSDIILLCVRWLVSALSLKLPQLGGDDAGMGVNRKPHDSVSMGLDLCS